MRLHSGACVLRLVALAAAVAFPPCLGSADATPGDRFASRSELTGDWGGVRDTLATHGLSVHADVTYTFQGVAGGGFAGPLFERLSDEDVLLLVLSSVVLLPLFEIEANRQEATYYGDRLFGAFATALRTSSWVPALIAVGFATGFIHYLLDRSVYRLSDPRVRAAARGLLG